MKSVLLIPLLAATTAVADCPVAGDIATGIRVTESGGTVNLFTDAGADRVNSDSVTEYGKTYRNVLVHGTHLIELGDTVDGVWQMESLHIVTYNMPTRDMPIPAPLTTWTVETSIATPGLSGYPETQTQRWGALTTLKIGNCTYDMIPGKITYTNEDFVVFEGLHYLPALELAFLHSYQQQGEDGDTYTAISIEVVQ